MDSSESVSVLLTLTLTIQCVSKYLRRLQIKLKRVLSAKLTQVIRDLTILMFLRCLEQAETNLSKMVKIKARSFLQSQSQLRTENSLNTSKKLELLAKIKNLFVAHFSYNLQKPLITSMERVLLIVISNLRTSYQDLKQK